MCIFPTYLQDVGRLSLSLAANRLKKHREIAPVRWEIDMDLNTLTLAELKKLLKDVTAAIANYEDRNKAKARTELEAKARELGFNLAELFSGEATGKRTRAAAPPKYRHPENPTETWSGRGRKPRWYSTAIAAGKSPKDLAI
jgi:DNA-binding protein H-NS